MPTPPGSLHPWELSPLEVLLTSIHTCVAKYHVTETFIRDQLLGPQSPHSEHNLHCPPMSSSFPIYSPSRHTQMLNLLCCFVLG